MNSHTSFALLAVLTLVGTLTMSSVYAAEQAYPSMSGSSKEAANQMLLKDVPISVWTDKTTYEHSSMIKVKGQVANVSTEFPVTLTVTNPLNSVVTIDQIQVGSDGSFQTTISTAGELWKYDGTYIVKVNYGSAEKSNKVLVELVGGVNYEPIRVVPNGNCITVEAPEAVSCVPFSISGGVVTGASINTNDNSIVVQINADDDGTLTLDTPQSIIKGVFLVLVDGEEWDDVEISDSDVTVMFPAGTEKIEIFGSWVIPEFGTIAAMILAVAIVSIIAISARSRLSIMPRY